MVAGVCVCRGSALEFSCLLEEGRESELDFRSQPGGKKIVPYTILPHVFRRKPSNLRRCVDAPLEGALREQ